MKFNKIMSILNKTCAKSKNGEMYQSKRPKRVPQVIVYSVIGIVYFVAEFAQLIKFIQK